MARIGGGELVERCAEAVGEEFTESGLIERERYRWMPTGRRTVIFSVVRQHGCVGEIGEKKFCREFCRAIVDANCMTDQ
ncbi:hypothetical protein LBMAG44_16990 [Gemmatimonadota bacterium]|nr:hypothetical protein LBMAG44_16990 [Gemmatimonadota bacterium]